MLISLPLAGLGESASVQHELALVLHGGAGVIERSPMISPGMFRAKLAEGGNAQMGIYKDEL
jgi:hypothetical protein